MNCLNIRLRRIIPLTALFGSRVGVGEEPVSGNAIQDGFVKMASQYFMLRDGSTLPLRISETPLLKWSNPERSREQFVFSVWLDGNLPMAVCSFFTYDYKGELRAKHEFQSLADVPLTTSFQGKNAWTPKEPGVKWKELTDFGPPSKSQRLRLSQIRRIASSFEVSFIAPNENKTKLRLMTSPLFRFSSPDHYIADGAIFS